MRLTLFQRVHHILILFWVLERQGQGEYEASLPWPGLHLPDREGGAPQRHLRGDGRQGPLRPDAGDPRARHQRYGPDKRGSSNQLLLIYQDQVVSTNQYLSRIAKFVASLATSAGVRGPPVL